ncbi:SGNH/GDSL hydrolase family protein [Bradyrhizobium sp. 150]|uniref:SGNH/GDSL hydrolase family protein n=1 Tax=Bradyrhizobium sp. 150 TaxID=2782625 RepID=UPI001FF87511|nr:SGNH/GDSL hydrolase family protein [Bradyrhizobium sp. 150]MCK1676636.1 SGNH/GDSL hydrolase family protein [Bradyrhizobium sp. 150]
MAQQNLNIGLSREQIRAAVQADFVELYAALNSAYGTNLVPRLLNSGLSDSQVLDFTRANFADLYAAVKAQGLTGAPRYLNAGLSSDQLRAATQANFTDLYTLLGGAKPLYPMLGLMASPPAATWKGDGTTTIAGAVTYNQLSGVWRYLNATATHASGYYQATPSTAEVFVADTYVPSADEVDLRFLRFNSSIMVFVNRQPISATAFTTDASGSANLLQLRFAGTPLEGQPKRIRVYGINILFAGMYISFGKTAALPTGNRPVMALETDSYGGDTGGVTGLGFYRSCFEALGYDVVIDPVGSTSYLTGAGATAAATRMTNRIGVLPAAPTRIGLFLAFNAQGGDMGLLATNHAATIAAKEAVWPGVPVDTWGPWTPQGETANLALVKNALIASAAANNSKFFDIANIINASNAATYGYAAEAPNYVHPNVAGHTYLGEQMALRGRAGGLLV